MDNHKDEIKSMAKTLIERLKKFSQERNSIWRFLGGRRVKFWFQRRFRGWDDSDTWNLDNIIAKFTIKRLKRFKELNIGFPCGMTAEEWDSKIDDMIYGLEASLIDVIDNPDCDWERVKRGNVYFGTYFRDLWW